MKDIKEANSVDESLIREKGKEFLELKVTIPWDLMSGITPSG